MSLRITIRSPSASRLIPLAFERLLRLRKRRRKGQGGEFRKFPPPGHVLYVLILGVIPSVRRLFDHHHTSKDSLDPDPLFLD